MALASEPAQAEIRQLVRLFDSALAGFLLDGQFRTFSDSSPEQQDERIRAWQKSRFTLRRTGYKALKKLVYAAYYAAPETWPATGYPGPPSLGALARPEAPAKPAKAEEAPKPQRRSRPAGPAPRPVEEVPAPRSGMDLPQEGKP